MFLLAYIVDVIVVMDSDKLATELTRALGADNKTTGGSSTNQTSAGVQVVKLPKSGGVGDVMC